jgi:hypothetical protein
MGQVPSIDQLSFPAEKIEKSTKRLKKFINTLKNQKKVTLLVGEKKCSFEYVEGETRVGTLLQQFKKNQPEYSKVVAFRTDPAVEILDFMLSSPRMALDHLNDFQILKIVESVSEDSKDPLASFIPIKTLGKGGFSLVTLVRKKSSGQLFALKTVSKDHIIKTQRISHILSERLILSKLTHPFILSLKCSFQSVKII